MSSLCPSIAENRTASLKWLFIFLNSTKRSRG
jgi:hypothetical protein